MLTSIGFLHLAYFATEITLHRCIIRSLRNLNSDDYLTHICRSAAKTRLISAMDFVNRLRLEHLKSFWYFPSQVSFALIGSFGSLLLATAPGQEETDFYKTRLGELRWTLGVNSRNASFLKFAVESLDGFDTILRSLPEKPSAAEDLPRGSDTRPTRVPWHHEGRTMEADDADQSMLELSGTAAHTFDVQSGLISPSTSVETASNYDAFT